MRVFVLLLAIVLLPLRGWLGDAMAMQLVSPAAMSMAAGTATATADAPHAAGHHADADAPTAPPEAMPHALHAAHGAHAESHPSEVDDGTATHHGSHADCTACQVCHSVAVADFSLPAAMTPAPHAAPRVNAVGFTSTALQPLRKPPIS